MRKSINWDTPIKRKFICGGGTRDVMGVGKLVAKIPMVNQVIDENNILWEYVITRHKTLLFQKVASVVINTQ